MKMFSVLVVLVAALGLSACGGGDEPVGVEPTQKTVPATPALPTVAVAPAPSAAAPATPALPQAPAIVADVTIQQLTTKLVVLPGERVRVTLFAVTCRAMYEDGWCPLQTPLGELGVTSTVPLQDLKVLYNGDQLDGWWSVEGDLYRFNPLHLARVYRAGTIEVEATVSPYAEDGAHTVVAFTGVGASFDKTMEFLPTESTLHVRAQREYAPMTLWASSGYLYPSNVKGGGDVTVTVVAECSDWNSCRASADFNWIGGLVPQSHVEICAHDAANEKGDCTALGSYPVDENGSAYLGRIEFVPGWFGGRSAVYTIRLTPQEPTYLYARDVEAFTGERRIAPKLPVDCTALTMQSCKG